MGMGTSPFSALKASALARPSCPVTLISFGASGSPMMSMSSHGVPIALPALSFVHHVLRIWRAAHAIFIVEVHRTDDIRAIHIRWSRGGFGFEQELFEGAHFIFTSG
jgi:hypothetical protein